MREAQHPGDDQQPIHLRLTNRRTAATTSTTKPDACPWRSDLTNSSSPTTPQTNQPIHNGNLPPSLFLSPERDRELPQPQRQLRSLANSSRSELPANLCFLPRQTSIGTGYDLSNSIFSPDGRNFQVEYAVKAVENGGTSVGIRCKEGVVLAVEKVVASKLLKPGANKRIATIDRHMGVVRSPLPPRHPWAGRQGRARANLLPNRYTPA